MKKNKATNVIPTSIQVIVCQECHEKTPLDAESIGVLKNLIKPTAVPPRSYDTGSTSKYQEPSTYDRPSRNQPADKNVDKYNYDRSNGNNSVNASGLERGPERNYDRGTDRSNVTSNIKPKVASSDAFQGISSKKTCTEHHE
jgi:hypothetical protein